LEEAAHADPAPVRRANVGGSGRLSPHFRRLLDKRGTAEPWIKEGKQAVRMTRLSCHRFRSNEVRLWLSVLAYNLGKLWRLVLPKKIENWSLSLQQRFVKTGGRLVKHARYYWLLLAESHLTRRRFGGMVRRMLCWRCRRGRACRLTDQILAKTGGGTGRCARDCLNKTPFRGFGLTGRGREGASVGPAGEQY